MRTVIVVTALAVVSAAIGAALGLLAAQFTPGDMFDVDITPEGDDE